MRFREQSKSRTLAATENPRGILSAKSSSGLALGLEWSSLLVVALTVCVLPWLLGGAIPKARLVLQVGTAAAAVLTLLARLVSGRSFELPPLGTALLLGIAAIGIVQLQPWMPSAISLMNHAVHPEFRENLPQPTAAAEASTTPKRSPADSRSVAPALTRLHVAQWIAVAVLLCVVADSLSRAGQLIWMLALLCLNASCLTILSLQQIFIKGGQGLSETWIISKTLPFGTFVNPNNAAGWLLVHVALAIGLVVVVWGKNPSTGWSRPFTRPSWRDHVSAAFAVARHRLASLNNIQILSLVTVVLLLTGVAATMSRAGIVAGIFCLVVCAASRMQLRKSLLLLVPFSILLAGVSISLIAFELDTRVLAELMTLKDPVSESTGRLLHWTDSLASMQDFPWLGSGQGAYAWSTLPYLQRGASTWFMNADNQCVEILVESGLLGFLLFAGFGVLLTVQSIQLIVNKTTLRSDSSLWTHRVAIGLAGTAMMSSQAIAAFFDFGIGLCSTMAAIAVFGGVLAAMRRCQPSLQTSPAWYALDGGLAGWVLRLALVAAVCGSIPELSHADRAYPAIVESARLFDSPVTRESLNRLSVLQEQLTAALRITPDDPVIRDHLVRVVEAQFRWRLIDSLAPPDVPKNDKQLQSTWPQLTPLGLAERANMLKKNPNSQNFQSLQALLMTLSQEFPWSDMAREASRQMPLAPGLAVDAAAESITIGKLDDKQLSQLTSVRFTDASGARRLYQCGVVCLLDNHQEQAVKFWNQSLQVSESFRANILVSTLQFRTPEQAIEMFTPTEYTATVRVALAKSTPELQEGLWKIAETQWLTVADDPNFDQRIQRANHISRRESPEELVKWIDHCLEIDPATLTLRQMRATTLEKQGRFDEAIGEWMRYEYFDPTSKQPSRSIKRLMDLTEKRNQN